MKKLAFIMLLSFLIGIRAQAELRSPMQRMNGVGSIDLSTLIHLRPPISDFSKQERNQVTLKTPHHSLPDANLVLEKRRSVVIIDDLQDAGLEPQLVERIEQVINNQWSQRLRYKKRGLENFFVLGNFVHQLNEKSDTNFFVAIIPKDIVVEEVIFQVEWYGNGAGAHTQIRLVLNQPIIAIPQWDDEYSPLIVSNQGKGDLIYSLQAAQVEGGQKHWSPALGLLGEYANALQLFSVQAKAKKQIYSGIVEQYRINELTNEQKKSILLKALKNSNNLQESTIYNTVFNSSVTHSILALRGEYQHTTKTYQGISQLNPIWFNPYSIIDKIKESGISLEKIETLNTEFAEQDYSQYGDIFNESMRQQSALYKDIAQLEVSIVTSPQFEDLVRKVAFYLAENEINAAQFSDFITFAKKSFNEELSMKNSNLKMVSLYTELAHDWRTYFPQRPIDNFFKALDAIDNSNIVN